jgi:hypothetical protein
MRPNHAARTATVIDFPEIRTTERAVCELCGDEISTINGGRDTGLAFVSFERLLDRHMEERHPNVCVLPAVSERLAA